MSFKSFLALVGVIATLPQSYAAPGFRPHVEERSRNEAGEAGRDLPKDLERIGRGEERAPELEGRGAFVPQIGLGAARDAGIQARAAKAFEKAANLELKQKLELGDFSEKTFFEAMTAKGGINDKFESDITADFKVATADDLHVAAESFDPSVYKKVTGLFKKGAEGLDALADALAGEKYNPETIVPAIRKELTKQKSLKEQDKVPLAAVKIAPFLSLASGGGVHVTLDANNSYFNIGYKKGSKDPEILNKAVKSGRSFGISNGHMALDASDVFYLKSLDAYLADAKSAHKFYETLMQTLTACETSGLSKLSNDGQAVTTDFFAVYTAELDRHLMTGLKQHPWENDLAEVTFLTAYGNASGLIIKGGELVEGRATDYFGVSQRGNGSGIGMTRKDRMALQKKVTAAVRELHPEIVERLEKDLGLEEGDDVIHGLMTTLNDAKTQASVRKNGAELTEAFGEFLDVLSTESDDITKTIK